MGTWLTKSLVLALVASTTITLHAGGVSTTTTTTITVHAGIKKSASDLVEAAECLTAAVNAREGLSKSSGSELAQMTARLEQAARALEKAVWDNQPPAQLAQYFKRTAGIHYEVVVLAKDALDKKGVKALRCFGCEFRKTGEEFSDYAYTPFHGYR